MNLFLGPMVYGTSYCSADNQVILKTLGCADSKVLSEQARDDIFDEITKQSEILGWAVHIISPTTISNCSFRRYVYEVKSFFIFVPIIYNIHLMQALEFLVLP